MSTSMANMIKNIKIAHLFGNTNIEWRLKKTNVLVGKNGMGKSTILQLIADAISQDTIYDKANLCSQIIVELISNNKFMMRKSENNIINILGEQRFKEIIIENIRQTSGIPEDVKNNFLSMIGNENSILNQGNAVEFISSDNNEKIDYEFVSTINLHANSTQNIAMGNGAIKNILDWEIQNELNRLLDLKDEKLNDKFIKSLNEIFKESDKIVSFNEAMELEFLFKNEKLSFVNLSSGERQIIYTLLKVAIATKNNALILMDEPEISLHLSWQEKLITQIRTINPDSQLIIVTHSPAIVMNGWLDSFVDIQDIIKGDSDVWIQRLSY